jgi:Flp pilus assembly protein TadD
LALILAEKPKELDEALKLATKAEEVAPEDPFSLDALGWVYVKQGKMEKAIEKLNQATKLRPQNPMFQYHLGVAYFKNNELTEAKRALQAALNISRDFKGAVEAQRIFEKIR